MGAIRLAIAVAWAVAFSLALALLFATIGMGHLSDILQERLA